MKSGERGRPSRQKQKPSSGPRTNLPVRGKSLAAGMHGRSHSTKSELMKATPKKQAGPRKVSPSVAGAHLSTTRELLRGDALLGGTIRADAAAFGARTMLLIDVAESRLHRLLVALNELTILPRQEDFVDAAQAFQELEANRVWGAINCLHGAARCWFYASLSGSNAAISQVAERVVAMAVGDGTESSLASAAVAWALAARGELALPRRWTKAGADEFNSCRQLHTDAAQPSTSKGAQVRPKAQSTLRRLPASMSTSLASGTKHTCDAGQLRQEALKALAQPKAIVFKEVGNSQGPSGRLVRGEFQHLLKQFLPLARTPDLTSVRRTLIEQWPHATPVIDALLGDLVGRHHLAMMPTLLVGEPGCGKSTLAARLAELLGVPSEVVNCGGLADSSLAGTSRRWSTAGPSVPVSLIRAHHHASPVIILDELEKGATSRLNGTVWDAMLSMTETSTAHRWRDPYLEAEVDLSHVIWLATANNVEAIPKPLRDRFRILRFPTPTAADVAVLANRLLVSACQARGLDPRWASALDQSELGALTSAWRGGSLRSLGRLVSAVLAAREHGHALH